MSDNPPGTTHRASVEIVGEATSEKIKECMDAIRELIKTCGSGLPAATKIQLRQEKVTDPLAKPKP